MRKAQDELQQLAAIHEAQVDAFERAIAGLEQEIVEKNDALSSAEDVVGCYTKELADQATQSAEVVNQWKGKTFLCLSVAQFCRHFSMT
jgi:hypothetical protein